MKGPWSGAEPVRLANLWVWFGEVRGNQHPRSSLGRGEVQVCAVGGTGDPLIHPAGCSISPTWMSGG
jgi:hypothetical protein